MGSNGRKILQAQIKMPEAMFAIKESQKVSLFFVVNGDLIAQLFPVIVVTLHRS